MAYDRIRDPRKLRHRIGDMEADYIYTAGIAGERFFTALRDEGKLLATRCEKCKTTLLPPRIYCDRCFAQLEKWVEVPATGVIETYTYAYKDMNGEPLSEPVIMAFIKITKTDGGLIHQIVGTKFEELRIGLPVQAVFKEKSKRKGALTDIHYFKVTSKS